MTLGEWMCQKRRDRTIQECAGRAGVPPHVWSGWERDRVKAPRKATYAKIARGLAVELREVQEALAGGFAGRELVVSLIDRPEPQGMEDVEALMAHGDTFRDRRVYHKAEILYQACLRWVRREMGPGSSARAHQEAMLLRRLGQNARLGRRYNEALRYYHEAFGMAEASGDTAGVAQSCLGLWDVEHDNGGTEAARWLARARSAYEELGDERGLMDLRVGEGKRALELGDFAEAAEAYRHVLSLRRKLAAEGVIPRLSYVFPLERVAELAIRRAVALGQRGRAVAEGVRLYSACEEMRRTLQAPRPEAAAQQHLVTEELAKLLIGAPTFEAERETGRSLEPEAAQALAEQLLEA